MFWVRLTARAGLKSQDGRHQEGPAHQGLGLAGLAQTDRQGELGQAVAVPALGPGGQKGRVVALQVLQRLAGQRGQEGIARRHHHREVKGGEGGGKIPAAGGGQGLGGDLDPVPMLRRSGDIQRQL